MCVKIFLADVISSLLHKLIPHPVLGNGKHDQLYFHCTGILMDDCSFCSMSWLPQGEIRTGLSLFSFLNVKFLTFLQIPESQVGKSLRSDILLPLLPFRWMFLQSCQSFPSFPVLFLPPCETTGFSRKRQFREGVIPYCLSSFLPVNSMTHSTVMLSISFT